MLKKNIAYLFVVQIFNYLTPFIALPFLTRTLGLESFGILAVALSIMATFQVIVDFGFNLSATRYVSIHRNKIEKISQYFGVVYVIKLIIYVTITSVGLFGLLINVEAYSVFYFGLISLNVLFVALTPIWFFQGIEKMKNITILTIISKSIYIILVFSLVRSESDVDIVLIAYTVCSFLVMLVSHLLVYKNGYCVSFANLSGVKSVFFESAPYFASRLSATAYTSFSVLFVAHYAGVAQAAIYSSAEKLYIAGQSAISPVSQALLPHLSYKKSTSILYKFVLIGLAFVIVCCFIGYVYSSEIVTLIFGQEFSESSGVLDILLFALVFNFISTNFGYPAFSLLQRPDVANKTVYLAGCLQILILTTLVITDNISIYTIAKSVLIVEFVVMILRVGIYIYLTRKKRATIN